MDKSKVDLTYFEEQIAEIRNELKKECRDKYIKNSYQINKIWTEQLRVPEIIGPKDCQFESLIDYVKFNEASRGIVSDKQQEAMQQTSDRIVE